MTTSPDASRSRTARTMFDWAASTIESRTGPMTSISSSSSVLGPVGEVALDLVDDLGVLDRALDRECEVVDLHAAQHDLQGAVVEAEHVLEGEHARPDLLGELGVARLEIGEDLLLGRAVRPVEQVDERRDAAGHRRPGRAEPAQLVRELLRRRC